ncbi:hypothetical protein M947_08065 [Sulfurimonas hongkongensis]|uniref:Uncharacterized protein n=1 Tax=Sulfurimonas hongkongensis TaxID=1172190 RepID=T0JLV9_9BACT|nr:hypothetical protein [Sulfurimonas hongkongensis]EQB39106.1 hypothetical protein M947_08065 [Sulfurimonas hongkongensis]
MEITPLLQSILGLVAILAILIFLLFLPSDKKKKQANIRNSATPQRQAQKTDLAYLRSIVKNKKSTTKELEQALALVIKHHGNIHPKLGARPHPDFDVYMDFLFTICRHPNSSKDIIINFDKNLRRLNPEYKKEINEAITKGLNSRRV